MSGVAFKDCKKEDIQSEKKGVLVYLAGDSYWVGDQIENKLARHLANDFGMNFFSQNEFLENDPSTPMELGKVSSVDERLEQLINKLDGFSTPVVLIGRSSGARVASLCAVNSKKVAAVIGLAYPFKHPNKPVEIERYKHLESTTVPTLIVQGVRDEYGGLVAIQNNRFSSFVDFFYINALHSTNLNEKTLNLVRMRIKRFILQAMDSKSRKSLEMY